MTKISKDEINGSPLYFFKKVHIIGTVIVFIITQIIAVVGAYYVMKTDISANTEHRKDERVHMPLEEKMKVFAPRTELDIRFNNIQNLLRDIKNDVRDIKNSQ